MLKRMNVKVVKCKKEYFSIRVLVRKFLKDVWYDDFVVFVYFFFFRKREWILIFLISRFFLGDIIEFGDIYFFIVGFYC